MTSQPDMDRCQGEPWKMTFDPFRVGQEPDMARCSNKPDWLIRQCDGGGKLTLCESCKKLLGRHIDPKAYGFERIVWPDDCLDQICTLRQTVVKNGKVDVPSLALLCERVQMLDDHLRRDGRLPREWRSYDIHRVLELLRGAEEHLRCGRISPELLPHVEAMRLYLDTWCLGPIVEAIEMVEKQAARE